MVFFKLVVGFFEGVVFVWSLVFNGEVPFKENISEALGSGVFFDDCLFANEGAPFFVGSGSVGRLFADEMAEVGKVKLITDKAFFQFRNVSES